ncbi:MAG: 2-amino-4-hydroxy-6-hydroxymethyldihydropteridine diphosphokinase, partial [Victivallaceae bacterium]|nr:2-amino-4-hydroxy-6-hydroxymethyldihydropteridine diphosphokinase [Victivallaceae bacterium]
EIVRSGIRRTAPVDCEPGTPDFLNQGVTGVWPGTAEELLLLGRAIEIRCGRPAVHSSRQARVFDCDLILFGEETISRPGLQVPHPRAKMRRFVLEPLAEIAPDWRFPDGETVADALKKVL